MGSKKKILQYLDYKGISVYKFEKIVGLSNGSLKSGKEFGVDKIRLIRDKYLDINMDWLLYDEGNMIKNEVEAGNLVANEKREHYRKEGPTGSIETLIKKIIKKEITKEIKFLHEKIADLNRSMFEKAVFDASEMEIKKENKGKAAG